MIQANSLLSSLTTDDVARLWRKVAKGGPGECWQWLDTPTPAGYGMFRIGGRAGGIATGAHRVVWEVVRGAQIPPGMVLDHLCKNTVCVNPDHLEPVTQRINVMRGDSLCATRTNRVDANGVCHAGHDLTSDAAWYRAPSGERRCRACLRDRNAARWAARKRELNIPDRNQGRLCDVDGCTQPYAAKGKCRTHYDKWRKSGRPASM